MKINDIYNPRQVYEGFFDTYFIQPFFRLYFNFKAHESFGTFIKSIIAWVIITLGIIGIMLGQIGIIGPEGGVPMARVVFWIWGIYSVIPMIGLFIRLANGAPEKPVRSRMLGIDVLLGVTSLLFFALGIVMENTVMQNEVLDPNANMSNVIDSNSLLDEVVEEEELYTYTDDNDSKKDEKKDEKKDNAAAPAKTTNVQQAAPADDPLKDLDEPDLLPAEESFDKSIEKPVEIPATPPPFKKDSI